MDMYHVLYIHLCTYVMYVCMRVYVCKFFTCITNIIALKVLFDKFKMNLQKVQSNRLHSIEIWYILYPKQFSAYNSSYRLVVCTARRVESRGWYCCCCYSLGRTFWRTFSWSVTLTADFMILYMCSSPVSIFLKRWYCMALSRHVTLPSWIVLASNDSYVIGDSLLRLFQFFFRLLCCIRTIFGCLL